MFRQGAQENFFESAPPGAQGTQLLTGLIGRFPQDRATGSLGKLHQEVVVRGRVVESGGNEIVDRLERDGYMSFL